MNEEMTVSRHGLMLIAKAEGKPRTKARRCEGGRYELSYGCTTWPDGRAIGPADVCTEDQALQLFAFHLHRFEAIVERHTKVALNQFQYDAHVSLAYNIGEGQYQTSTALGLTNEGNFVEAAHAFGRFQWATSPGPSEIQRKSKSLQSIIMGDRWKGPEGQPCNYRQALLGLLRRHHGEGLLSLGLPWEWVFEDDFVYIDAERVWNPAKGGYWEDIVHDFRSFADCKAKAEAMPKLELAPPAASATIVPFDLDEYQRRVDAAPKPPVVAAPTKPVDEPKPSGATQVAPPASKTPPAPVPAAPKASPPAPLPPAPVPHVPEFQVPKGMPTPSIPPPLKPMDQTRRFWGAFLYYGGKIVMALGVSTAPGRIAVAFGETWGAVVKDPVLFGMAIDALCFTTGWFMDHCGHWIRKWGERHAKGPMVSGGEPHATTQAASVSTQTAVVTTQTATVSTGGG